MADSQRILARNSAFLISNLGFVNAAGFAFWIVTARVYSSEEVGLSAGVIAIAGFVATAASLGLPRTLLRYFTEDTPENHRLVTGATIAVASTSLVIACTLMIVAGASGARILSLLGDPSLAMVFIAYCVSTSLVALQDSFLVSRRLGSILFAKNAFFSIARLPLTILFAGMDGSGPFLAVGVTNIASAALIFVLCQGKHIDFRTPPIENLRTLRKSIRFSTGSYVSSVFETLPGSLLPIIAVETLSSSDSAYFYISWMIGGLLFSLPAVVYSPLVNEASRPQANWRHLIRTSAIIVIAALGTGIFVLAMFSSDILSFMGERYLEFGSPLLLMFALSAAPIAVNQLAVAVTQIAGSIKFTFLYWLTASGVFVSASIVLMESHGIRVTGLIWLVIQTAFALPSSIVVLREYRKRI